MDCAQRLEAVIEYLEEHLYDKIDYDDVAQIAGCKTFRFVRLFSVFTGMTIGDYLLGRRMTLAGRALAHSPGDAMAVALEFGYYSLDDFNSAFTKFHGMAPTSACENPTQLASLERFDSSIISIPTCAYDYSLVNRDSFQVVGFKHYVSTIIGDYFTALRKYWYARRDDGTIDALEILSGGNIAMHVGTNFKKTHFPYYLAVEANDVEVPVGMDSLQIPKATWAVFETSGPRLGLLQSLLRHICADWQDDTEYDLVDGPELWIIAPTDGDDNNCDAAIWLPVAKKSAANYRVSSLALVA